MTTPKDTWISVKDAVPPIETPEGFTIIGSDKFDYIYQMSYHDGRLMQDEGKYFVEITFWMLLSKPKITN
jgi:hypothetical protein